MARVTTEEVRNIGSVYTTYQWNFVVVTPPAALPNFPSSRQLNARAQSSDTPTKTNEKIIVTMRGHRVAQAGPDTFNSPLNVTFIETSDNTIFNMLRQWQEVVTATNTGAHGDKLDVEAVVELQLLSRNDIASQAFTLFGVFPESSTPASLGSEGGEVYTNQIAFHYDYFRAREL